MEKIIKEYLENFAKETGWQKFNADKMKECISYIRSEAKKQAINGCACIKDEEVFGWAVHFFDEDITVTTSVSNANNDNDNVEVENYKETALKASKPAKKTKKAKDDNQLNLFDLLG